MAVRKYRGIDIDSKHIDMAKNLDSVHELIDELRDLQATWNNLSLLGELTNVGAEISSTRQHFQQLASDLTNFLVEQSTRQSVEVLATRAQNSIDILVRNLYERTADIGFLATDPVFTQCCIDASADSLDTDTTPYIRQRMKNYAAKYSVYENVILLDQQSRVIVDMQNELAPGTALKWIAQKVASSQLYVEAFQPLLSDLPEQKNKLIYAWKINSDSQITGYIALVFNLHEESEALFSKVMGHDGAEGRHEWRVCGVSNAEGDVLISSNPQYLGAGQTIRLPHNQEWGIAQIGPVAYLTCQRPTRGYQGYLGPGWKGFCMVPLSHAFNTSNLAEQAQPPELDTDDGLIDERIQRFQNQATQIQKQLNRSIWNGNMTQRNSNSALGNSFSKTLLWEISRAGESTKALFTESLDNLVSSEIIGFQTEQQARAMLAMDVMDRNLYERANDCRWWALTPVLAHALEDGDRVIDAVQCLKHIQSLYTVYTNIVLLDAAGQVVCDSTQQIQPGVVINASWVRDAMLLKSQAQYCVSEFESTSLYQNRPTYIYAAAIFKNPDNPTKAIGAIALIFDSEPQFEAILNESMGDNRRGAFAFIVDEQRRIISSTTHQHTKHGKLDLPMSPSGQFEPEKTCLGYIEKDGRLIAYGTCNSGSYREYKSHSDPYENKLMCVYGLDIGALKQTQDIQAGDICFDEFRQGGPKDLQVDIASFRIGSHWYGIDSEDAVEAFLCKEIATLPHAPECIVGTTLYRQEAVTIVDISKILTINKHTCTLGTPTPRQQMILLKTPDHGARVALAVDELGEIPSLPMTALQESKNLPGQGGIIQGLIKTNDNVLVVLNTEQLIKRLASDEKKAPRISEGLFSEALPR